MDKNLLMSMLLAFGGADLLQHKSKQTKTKPVKVCLNCKKSHSHNNSFCSAACCKEYKRVE